MDDDMLALARGMKHLYEESAAGESSPIYRELESIGVNYGEKEFLDKGGMKSIYQVFDKKADRYVALAELHKDSPESLFENFLREARLTAKLEHPNIISVHDIGILENERPYFTMDLKVGDSLRVILEKLNKRVPDYEKRYSLTVLLEIFNKICDAMDYAHSRGVIHLDLKPDNIQIGLHGEVLVCDWGLAKIISEAENFTGDDEVLLSPDLLNDVTRKGEFKGTPGFMAPEQAIEKGVKTEKTDIYAMGCILFSILTYEHTVSGDLESMMESTRTGRLIPPSEKAPEKFLPATLDAIFSKATALDPEDRYSSIRELKEDISKFQAGFSTSVDKVNFVTEATLFYRRNKPACWTAAALLTVMIIGTLLFIFSLNRRIAEAETANDIASHLSNKIAEEESRLKIESAGEIISMIKNSFESSFPDNPLQSVEIISKQLTEFTKNWPDNEVYDKLIRQLSYITAEDPVKSAEPLWRERRKVYQSALAEEK